MKRYWKGRSMKMNRHHIMRRVMAVLFAMVMLVIPTAQGHAEDVDFSKSCDITVDAVGNKSDLTADKVQIDLYRISAGEKNEGYTGYTFAAPEGPFASLGDLNQKDVDWEALNEQAAAILEKNYKQLKPVASAKSGAKMSGLEPGLYIYVIHSADKSEGYFETAETNGEKKVTTTVKSSKNTYWYTPGLIALPGLASEDGEEWIYSYSGDNTIMPKEGKNPPPPTVVKTGDDTDMRPYFMVLGISGLLILVLAVLRVRSGRTGNETDGE